MQIDWHEYYYPTGLQYTHPSPNDIHGHENSLKCGPLHKLVCKLHMPIIVLPTSPDNKLHT